MISWVSLALGTAVNDERRRGGCLHVLRSGACVCWNSMPHPEMNTKGERDRESEREREL